MNNTIVRANQHLGLLVAICWLSICLPKSFAGSIELTGDQSRTVLALFADIKNSLGSTRTSIERRLGRPFELPLALEQELKPGVARITQYSKSFVFAEANLQFQFTVEFGVCYDDGDKVKSLTIMLPRRRDDNWVMDSNSVELRVGSDGVARNFLLSEMRIIRDTILNEGQP